MEEELVMVGPWGLSVQLKTCSCTLCTKLDQLRQEVGTEELDRLGEAIQLALVESGGPVGRDLWFVAFGCLPLADYEPLKRLGDEVFNAWVLHQAVQTGLYAGWGGRYAANPLRHGGYGVAN